MHPESDWFATPIYVLNFNLVSYLRKLISWLLRAGYRNIIILDNHSTYPPLLQYYAALAPRPEITVIRRDENDPKPVVWDEHLRAQSGPFVLTTGDVVPDSCCPDDVVAHLASHLRANPQLYKAGLGLRIDNLPKSYVHRDKVLVKQSEYWRAPAARGLFLAPIDFTFALYRGGGNFEFDPAARTSWPYLARHEPWYSNSSERTEEECYYAANISPGRGSWGRDQLPDWILNACAQISAQPSPRLLHLACGGDFFPGWINVDADPACKPDIVFDLKLSWQQALPLADESIDGFFIGHTFAQTEVDFSLLGELYRIARPGARLIVRVFQPRETLLSPIKSYRIESFDAWSQPNDGSAPPSYMADWQVERIHLIVFGEATGPEFAQNVATQMGTASDVVRELVLHLRAVKPPRSRRTREASTPLIEIGVSPLDEGSAF